MFEYLSRGIIAPQNRTIGHNCSILMIHNLKNYNFRTKLWINGKFVNSLKGDHRFDVFNPSTGEVIAKVLAAGTKDVGRAIKAARMAFDHGPWRTFTPTERAKCLNKLADLIEANIDELAELESLNNGKPLKVSKAADLGLTIQCYRYYAGWADKIQGQVIPMSSNHFAYTTKEPVGVAGQIIPWNFPLLMQAWKFGPALAAGCTVVMKTSPNTPLTALRVAELSAEAGFPPGVINVLSGHAEVGSALTTHKDIDKIAFTGSTKVGLEIIKGSHAHHLKRVTLQLGGKSANIITANANLDKAVDQACMGLYFNAGQCCIAASRTFVHESLHDEFVERVKAKLEKFKVGDAFDPETTHGPVVCQSQFDKIMSYIAMGQNQRAKVIFGGKRIGTKGYFIEPTLFTDVTDSMIIAKEEIFGPVMCVMKYKTTEEVVRRANDSRFGLGAGVVTEDAEQALQIIRELKSGTVYHNCWNVFSANAPFGGFRDSGIGRELGEAGLNNYLELKTVIHNIPKRLVPEARDEDKKYIDKHGNYNDDHLDVAVKTE